VLERDVVCFDKQQTASRHRQHHCRQCAARLLLANHLHSLGPVKTLRGADKGQFFGLSNHSSFVSGQPSWRKSGALVWGLTGMPWGPSWLALLREEFNGIPNEAKAIVEEDLSGASEDKFARDGDVFGITRGNEDAGTIAEPAANGFWPTKDSDDACTADLTNRTDEAMLPGPALMGDRNPKTDGVALTILKEFRILQKTKAKIN
jgi:hypothetical protein